MTTSFFLLNTCCRNKKCKCGLYYISFAHCCSRHTDVSYFNKIEKKSQTFPRREPNYHEGIDYLCSGHSSAQLRQIPLVDDNGQLWGEIRSENYIHHNPNISSSNASQNMPELISL